MAEQEKPVRRRVAVKLIKAGIDNRQVLARFEAERQALAMMNHENIARILDAGTTEQGQPYFVMELVQGIPFNKYCDENQMSVDDRLKLFIPVCKAIQHAHQKGIIHRDLKPSNVLVCLYDGVPVPKVIDFGLAKALQHQTKLTDKTMFTEFGQVVGTLQYMSPEQAEMNQLDIDTRTDVYSLGVMLYELMAGSTPIESDTLQQQAIFKVLESIREKEPPRPSIRLSSATNEAVTDISKRRQISTNKLKDILQGDLDWIVMKAIEKNRSRRYETASGFADDIQNYLDNEIVTARPPSPIYRLQKYSAKNKGLLTAVILITTSLLAGIASTTWLYFDASEARNLAEQKEGEAESQRILAEENLRIAQESERAAEVAAKNAEDATRKSRNQLVRFYIDKGMQLASAKNPWHALNWFVKAYETDPNPDEASGSSHRLRIGTALAKLPKVLGWFFHQQRVHDIEFSPDGTQIVALCDGGSAWLYEMDTQQAIGELTHQTAVHVATFSPDGRTIATGGADERVKFWDAATGRSINKDMAVFGMIQAISFHPTRPIIAVAAGEVIIWDLEADQAVTIEDAPKHAWHIEFAKNGQQMLMAYDNHACVWDTQSWKPVCKEVAHDNIWVDHILKTLPKRFVSQNERPVPLITQDGKWLIAERNKGKAVVNLSDGKEHLVTVSNQRHFWAAPNGQELFSADYDDQCQVFSINNGKLLRTFKLPSSSSIQQIDHHPTLPIFIVGSQGGAHLLSAATGENLSTVFKNAKFFYCLNFTPDGYSVVFSEHGTVCETRLLSESLVSTAPPATMKKVSRSRDRGVNVWAFSIKGGKGIAVVESNTGKVVSATDDADPFSLSVVGEHELMRSLHDNDVRYTQEGRHAVIVKKGRVRIWDMKTCKLVACLDSVLANSLSDIKFSSDGSRFLTKCSDKKMCVFETATGRPLGKPTSISDDDNRISAFTISKDGSKWATGTLFGELEVFDTKTSATEFDIETIRGRIETIEFDPTGGVLATANPDGICQLWNAKTGDPICRSLSNAGTKLKFDSDGRRLITAGSGKISLWDTRTGNPLAICATHGYTKRVAQIFFDETHNRIYFTDRSRNGYRYGLGSDSIVRTRRYEGWYCLALPSFTSPLKNVPYVNKLATGTYISESEGMASVGRNQFQLIPYRDAWFAHLGRVAPDYPASPVQPLDGKIGEIMTLDFKIASTGGNPRFYLNSEKDFQNRENISVVIFDAKKKLERLGLNTELIGKRIRVTGEIVLNGSWVNLELKDQSQIEYFGNAATSKNVESKLQFVEEVVERPTLRESEHDWHARCASELEDGKKWYAAAFHLEWLAQEKPDDAEIKIRLSGIGKKMRAKQRELLENLGMEIEETVAAEDEIKRSETENTENAVEPASADKKTGV